MIFVIITLSEVLLLSYTLLPPLCFVVHCIYNVKHPAQSVSQCTVLCTDTFCATVRSVALLMCCEGCAVNCVPLYHLLYTLQCTVSHRNTEAVHGSLPEARMSPGPRSQLLPTEKY